MKYQMYKKMCFVLSCLAICLVFTLPAWSLTIDGGAINVGDVDTLFAAKYLPNSGDNTEESWVESIIGFDVTFSEKIEGDDWNWMPTNEENIWALELQEFPEYYIVKTGNLNTDPNYSHFLFENNDELSWAVINLTDFGAAPADINIFKVSHIATFTGVNPVPEPATMVLFGIGLLGIAGLGRRTYKK